MYLPAFYFVTPILASIMCEGGINILTRWQRMNEATNVKYKIYVLCSNIEYISSNSFGCNHLPKHRTPQYTIIRLTSTHTY